MSVRAGNLRDRVTIERPVSTPDGYGGQVDGWEVVAAGIAADVRPVSGGATTEAEALVGTATHKIMIRLWDTVAGVNATHRVLWRGRVMKVLGAVPDYVRRTIEMTVETGAAMAVAVALIAASAFHPHTAQAGAVMVATGTPPALPALPAITRYVAPETGNDSNDGLTPSTPWLYPPGDSRATHGFTPVAGQHIAFKGGERYTGNCGAVSGVIYSGNAWGTGRCIFDGSAPVTVRLPVDAADAGGHPDWASGNIRVAEWTPDGLPFRTTLLDPSGAMVLAPALRNPEHWMRSDVDRYPGLTYTGLDGAELRDSFQITSATVAAACTGEDGRGQLWIRLEGNSYTQRTVTGVSGSVTSFDSTAWGSVPYSDSNQRVMLFNCVKHVTQPGDYAVLSDGKAIFRSRGSLAVRRAIPDTNLATQPALNLSGRSNVEVRGFLFRGFSNRDIFRSGSAASGWLVRGNVFEWCELWGGACANLSGVTSATVSQNRFRYFTHLSNCITGAGPGNVFEWNVMHGLNATATRLFSDDDGVVCRFNIITDANGIHGNAISPYQNQGNITVSYNAVIDCMRPLTTQVDTEFDGAGRFFEGNVFQANARGNGWAFWHNNGTRGLDDMTLRRNICLGASAGILVHQKCLRLVLDTNWSTDGTAGGDAGEFPGVAVNASPAPDNRSSWTVTGPTAIAETYLADVGALLELDRVDIPRPDGTRLQLDLRTVGA